MAEQPRKENFIHRILRTKPWVYALLLLAVLLVFFAICFDKIAMPIVAREHVQELTVPKLEGLDSSAAIQKAEGAGFHVAFAKMREYSKVYDVDLVMRQNPPEGQKSKPGRTIHLTLSEGLNQITVPDLLDKTDEEAVEEIQKAGLVVGLTFKTPHVNISKGKVVRTYPSEGSLAHKGDTVDVFISSGAKGAKTEVPNVVGERTAIAISNLRTAGFIVGKTERKKEGSAGLVLSQKPEAGSLIAAGARVNLVISE
ncbi:MAG: PASTA domain-containing protein [Hallerella porci]|uniref:Beta-lactam-binding protein with PASTA domain n=1 Tax=Hallerella porci TaxID=1945871 RepID=A0ABX5LNH8_9BACT|nr:MULTISPECIES: PASTA domain-containing protein [Hallerella]MCI5600553.1 PASTA domain-containing protein [Hallerella sp.]MDY3920933.1 PASTA domain-containing protein [Hallerella porci]PWL00156.1 beta-lactam-binding protein with PASTA domain [Hallerella porci]